MIIEVVIFFIWMFIVALVGVIVVFRRRRQKLQGIENISAHLTFPQRNWLPLCIVVALASPLAVAGFKAATHKEPKNVVVNQNGASYQSTDSSARDTSYHVATPPTTAGAPGSASAPSSTPAPAPAASGAAH